MEDFLDIKKEGEACTVRETVNNTLDHIDYNGLPSFNKTAKQISEGKSFIETKIDSSNEELGSTCVGMSHALLKELKSKHNIEGMFAVERRLGKEAFSHAAVIVQCNDGYVLLDTRSNPNHRIFSVPFGESITSECKTKTFTASHFGSATPLRETVRDFETNEEFEFEFCTHCQWQRSCDETLYDGSALLAT